MNPNIFKMLLALLLATLASSVSAAENFLRVDLPNNVSAELPRNWTALSKNQRITLDSMVQTLTERLGVFDATADLNFAANYFEDTGKVAAMFNIRYYPELTLTQDDANEFTTSDVSLLDATLRTSIDNVSKGLGCSIIEWRGTKRQSVNAATIFTTEYTLTPIQNNGEFCVRLVRVFRGKASYTITISYRISQELLLRPICDRVISSIRNR